MTLEDVIKYGKRALKVESIREQYVKDNSLNPTIEVAKLDGLDRTDPATYANLEAASLNMAPAKHRRNLEDYIGANAGYAVGEVLTDSTVAIKGITKDDVLRQYLLSVKPKNYDGADATVFEAYEGAVKSIKLLNDEKALNSEASKFIGKTIQKLKDKKHNAGLINIVARMYSEDSSTAIAAVQKSAFEKIAAFEKVEKDKLVKYAIGRFNSLSDAEKGPEAYEIAKAVARSN